MSDDIRNKGFDLNDKAFAEALPKVKPHYSRTKEQVWEQVEQQIKERPSVHRRPLWHYAIAAAVTLMLGLTGFMRWYTEDYSTSSQEMVAVLLPDGSQVQLNSSSDLAFHPYWWRVNRAVSLNGEAFFEVAKGEKFDVNSPQGVTSVLGTSFNVYARGEEYEVICHTGKVRVSDPMHSSSIDLLPQEKAILGNGGKLQKEDNVDLEQARSWTEAMFRFQASPIAEVFRAIEHQYQVQISYPSSLNHSYSGQFSRELAVEQVMDIVCRTFGLAYSKNGNTFIVSKP